MKSLTQFLIATAFLIFVIGIAWFFFSARIQQPAQILPAVINRDCAPWDGSAFTVSIPISDGTTIVISIWTTPDINFPVTYSFPDKTMNVGNAFVLYQAGSLEQLTGTVSVRRVEDGHPVEGKFDLSAENGKQFNGQFKAEWGNEVILCG